jgi:O-antigen/teichoic acid export membrane protein
VTAVSPHSPAATRTEPAPNAETEAPEASRPRLLSRSDLAVAALLAALALAFVGPALVPGRALLPLDALFGYPPWQAHADNFGVGLPSNSLIADAILQNYSWKRLARESILSGELPLWNPYILAGQPFMASAQNGSLYPLGIFFYVLPLTSAYGWFIALHLWIGALGAYWLARMLGANRIGGVIAGLTFGFCGYLVVSFLWPMVVSTAVWLPALLATIEWQVQRGARVAIRAIALGGLIVGLQFLAGHLEMSLYLLLTAGLYTALRLAGRLRSEGLSRPLLDGLVALAMVVLGTGLAAIQLVPFAEVIGANVRTGWSDYEETVGYAMPKERLLAYLVPNLFGNPTHHTYYDLVAGQTLPTEHTRPNGERRTDTEWGGKNYVEGAVYVGILPLLLAAVAVLARPRGGALALALVGLVSLLFAFGTPLYALLFYGIPGVNQLHTPFRWVYPFSLCIAVLAGLGAARVFAPTPSPSPLRGRGENNLAGSPSPAKRGRGAEGGGLLGVAALIVGTVALIALAAALLFPEPSLALAALAMRRWPELRDGFGSPEMLYSYQWLNLAVMACLLTASGLVLWVGARRHVRLAGLLAVVLLTVDLFSFGIAFNTAADTRVLDFVPQSIAAIKVDPTLFRVVTYGDDDTLPSNTNMLFGLHDMRGYDTIILREYVDYVELIEPQRGIPYSKVAKLFDQGSLASPLLDLLNVKYVLTSKSVSLPNWTLHAQGDGIRVYRNERVMPRVFVVDGRQIVDDRIQALAAIRAPGFDPRRQAVVEGAPATLGGARPTSTLGSLQAAEVLSYENNRVVVQTPAESAGGVLVLADVSFPGWIATVDGAPTTVLRANGLFRAVELPPGEHTVVFSYRPLAVRIGALLTAISVAILLGLVGLTLASRRVATTSPLTTAQRVFRNSAFPMTASLLNKAIDLGFAVIMFRVLGPEGVGAYTFAGVLTAYFDIVVGWGLATLITRDVARDPAGAGRYLGNATALRVILWFGAAGATALLVGPLGAPLGIDPPLAFAIWLLVLGLVPSLLSGVLSALFLAHERMEVPAGVTVFSTVSKVVLGLAVLFAGWGYVGLAAVSIATNVATLILLAVLYAALIGWPRPSVDPRFLWLMLGSSFPLLVNGLLNQLFFKIDVLLLKPLAGDLALGWYSTAYKVIDGLQVIPASFVIALFPLLSRLAPHDRRQLARVSETGLKVLLALAFPIAVGTTLLAEPIVLILAGPGYLPESAWALQILIWYLPISFVNGLLQYVLIAVNRQRTLSVAFGVGVLFNVAANLALIPAYGYLGAAVVTVASELVLLAPFLWVTLREVGSLAVLGVAWRPAIAAVLMALPIWLLAPWSTPLAIVAGALVYGAALLALRTLTAEERGELRALVRRESPPPLPAAGGGGGG